MAEYQTLQSIGLQLRNVNYNFRQAVDRAMQAKKIGLSFGEIAPMISLIKEPGTSGAELARRCLVSPQAMNNVLRKLAEKAYVERRPNPESQRADCWYLTEAGHSLLARSAETFETVTTHMLSGLTEDEILALDDYLRRCAASLGEPD